MLSSILCDNLFSPHNSTKRSVALVEQLTLLFRWQARFIIMVKSNVIIKSFCNQLKGVCKATNCLLGYKRYVMIQLNFADSPPQTFC